MICKQGGHQTQGADSEPDDVPDMGNASAFWEAVKLFSGPSQAKGEPAAGPTLEPQLEERVESMPLVGESARPGKIPGNKLSIGL